MSTMSTMSTPTKDLSPNDSHNIEGLVAWLQTFTQVQSLEQQTSSLSPVDFLSEKSVATAILNVAEEVFCKPTAREPKDTVEAIWGQIFAVSSAAPNLMQKIQGRRLSPTELRFVLLSAMLCSAISETCSNRRTYIGRIMELPKQVQHCLMTLIESFPRSQVGMTPSKSPQSTPTTKERTPKTTPSRSAVEATPKSAAARKNSGQPSTPGPTPGRRVGFSSPPAYGVQSTEKDLISILAWIRTIPLFNGMTGLTNTAVFSDRKVVSAVLRLAQTISGQTPSQNREDSVEELWAATEKAVSKISSTAISLSVSATQTPVERQCAILSALLCHAVSDGCYDRKTHIGRVLSLPKEIQKRVMNIIERGRQIMSPRIRVRATPARDTAIKTPGSRRNRDEAFGTPASGYTPRRKKQSSGAGEGISAEGLFSPRTIENALGNIMEDLRIQNETLNTELETSQQREMELGAKIQEMEQSVRKQMMKVESEAYRNKEESRVDHEEEIKRLQEELKSLQKVKEQEENAQLELARVRDEIDLLKHTKDRLAETEEKFRMCRERLEELSEVREALKREEQAHAASVEECLRLDNDVKTLQPLRRQVEEYKTRAVDAEVKLAECQEDLKKVSHLSKHLSSAHKELLQGAKLHKEEAEELRKRLYEEDQQKKGPAIGESLSELNPQVREELSRLRNENVQLRDFAAKREVDSVQRLEEDLDDATRLSNKFKDQFLLYKNNLEATTKELVESQKNEANLSVQLDESRSKWEALNERANHLENALMTTREELDETAQMLKESKQREEGLINDVKTWVEKHAETEALSNQRQHTLDETRSELDQTKASLEKSRERETDLESIVKDLNGKIGQHQTFEEELQTQLQQRGYEVSDLQSKLQNASEREVTLKGELLGSSEQRLELEQKLEKKQLAHEAAVQEATEKLSATKENLQNKRKADLKQLQSKMDTILSEERETYHNELKKAADDYANLMAKSSTEYQKLKENASSALQTTKEEASAKAAETKKAHEEEVAKMKSKAEAEREKLIQKGKTMLRESRSKAQATIKEIEDELNETQESLANVRKDKESFENQARSKIHSYKHKLKFATSRMKELSDENTDLQESINNVEREKLKVQEENERFRRQLGGRYGADGKVQSQLEMLQKEFSAVVEDNRTLKRKLLATGGSSRSLGSISESNEFEDGNSKRKYSRGGVSGSTLSSMREEYEEQLQALNDEKRELIMRNSAAISETQKAEQRAWELEKELGRIKEELTSTQLSLQRAERDAEDDTDVSHYDEHPLIERASTLQGQEHRSSNLLLKLEEKPVPDKSYSVPILPTNTMSTMSTTDTSSTLEKESYGDENVVPQPKSSMAKSNPMESGPSLVESTNGPSLVELTQPGNGQDGQPECKQS